MCDRICLEKIAEDNKKYQLKEMLGKSFNSIFGEKNKEKNIRYFLENENCCKNCKYQTDSGKQCGTK